MADIIGAIVEALKADTEASAAAYGRIFGNELPADESKAMPRRAVVIKPSGGASLTTGTFSDHDTQRFDGFFYGETPYEANGLRMICRRALVAFRRQVVTIPDMPGDGCLIHWVETAGGFSAGRDPNAAWPVAFQSFQTFFAPEPEQ